MHIQWKKIITLTLTALALTAVLAGCGSTQNSSAEKKEITGCILTGRFRPKPHSRGFSG